MPQQEETVKQLKTGFSTGACAAATAKAAYLALQNKLQGRELAVLFPDTQYRNMVTQSGVVEDNQACTMIIKDAGDDPDVTHRAEISATIMPVSSDAIKSEDIVLIHDDVQLVLRGGAGVGLVTRGGLDVPAGKWAINPVPQQMILDNLLDVGFAAENGCWLVIISVKDGEQIAQKTLNPILGVMGGISILGTSGIVVPHSHKAYIDTIKMLLKNAAAAGHSRIVLCTGAKTHRLAKLDYPDINDEAFIRIGDFIADTLNDAANYDFKQVIVACMPGKLFKYAMGIQYTHAHHEKLVPADIAPVLMQCEVAEKEILKVTQYPTIREIINALEAGPQATVIQCLKQMALDNVSSWCKGKDCEIRIYGYE